MFKKLFYRKKNNKQYKQIKDISKNICTICNRKSWHLNKCRECKKRKICHQCKFVRDKNFCRPCTDKYIVMLYGIEKVIKHEEEETYAGQVIQKYY